MKTDKRLSIRLNPSRTADVFLLGLSGRERAKVVRQAIEEFYAKKTRTEMPSKKIESASDNPRSQKSFSVPSRPISDETGETITPAEEKNVSSVTSPPPPAPVPASVSDPVPTPAAPARDKTDTLSKMLSRGANTRRLSGLYKAFE